MDFMCDGCGKWHWIPSESKSKQDAIENLELWLDQVQRNPWMIEWLEYHEPELMARLRKAVDKLLSRK